MLHFLPVFAFIIKLFSLDTLVATALPTGMPISPLCTGFNDHLHGGSVNANLYHLICSQTTTPDPNDPPQLSNRYPSYPHYQATTIIELMYRLIREGKYDRRYMAASLEEAALNFVDMTENNYTPKNHMIYTKQCDARCTQKTQQIVGVFRQRGVQFPTFKITRSQLPPDFARQAKDYGRQVDELPTPPTIPSRFLAEQHFYPGFREQTVEPDGATVQPDVPPSTESQQNAPESTENVPATTGTVKTTVKIVKPTVSAVKTTELPIKTTKQATPSKAQEPKAVPVVQPALNVGLTLINQNAAPAVDLNHGSVTEQSEFETTEIEVEIPPGYSGFLTPEEILKEKPDSSEKNNSQKSKAKSRSRRDSQTSLIGTRHVLYCSAPGSEEKAGMNTICGACRAFRELPEEYFPRYLNEVSCPGVSCISGAGICAESHQTFDIFRNIGTWEQQNWINFTITTATCCNCLMAKTWADTIGIETSSSSNKR